MYKQLKGLLGILHTSKLQFIPVMTSVFDHRDEIMRKPKLVWESAAVPLTAAILSSSALNQKAHGISFVGVPVVKILLHVTRPNTGNWEYIPSTQIQRCLHISYWPPNFQSTSKIQLIYKKVYLTVGDILAPWKPQGKK
ncbi:hypothetical protein GOBAR_AA36714 [Gossypium barbadense]|uniref:Uncharacterized protein n=1 Tax=Gossypium barbadense TaxID=3634 RepID=A0A2P5VYU2_GOSBA|nr:hypothetical protein GOBAR_AA36714 [Gossypium barbadense]